ncbi:unnamed protein product [Schistosoma margrebowiei]|uniref:Uncharacterized protein n=1 Tax=Schistosoma margrebowiei TaxID=48269 RepID=A0A183MKW8_9TREM|nr:unnamed protein product [Schistosoma margrebowiei]
MSTSQITHVRTMPDGPNVSNSVIVSTLIRPSITSLEASVYEVDSPSLSVFHRELWLSAIINRAPLEQNAKVSVNINTSIQVQIPHLATAGSRSAMFKSDPNYKNSVVQMGPIHNRTIQVNCPDTKCDELFLFHLIPVDFTIYKFRVTFYNELTNNHLKYEDYEDKHLLFEIISVDFIFQYYTIEFTYMESFKKEFHSIHYVDPLYPLQYLTTNWFPSCLGYLFQITFVAVLLLVWLCIFHGIRIFTVVFISLFGFIYVVLFTVLFIRACHKLRKLPYFNLRLYFLTFQSIIFIIVLGFACLLHFNERLLSQSMNYVRNVKDNISKMTAQQQNSQNYIGLQHRFNDILGYHSTLEFSLIQFTINSYIILLAFVYSPPNNTQIEMDVKDNPSLSMINDSDEDVIYE